MQILRTSVSLLLAAAAVAQAPCWETNLGVNLGLGDDADAAQQLGFTFPFNGVNYTDIVINSNGNIWLGNTPGGTLVESYTPDVTRLLTQTARLAPLWCDFNPTAAGSGQVYANTFAASPGVPARAVITWDNVYEYGRTQPISFQVQLLDDGTITYHYGSNTAVMFGGFGAADHVIGTSAGSGATANAVNFAATPIVTPGVTAHQSIARGNFPLVGKDLQFFPAGAGFAVTERPGCGSGSFTAYGVGCPGNMTAFEYFDANNFDLSNRSFHFIATGSGYVVIPSTGIDNSYSAAITVGDDAVVPQTLPFSFPFAGQNWTQVDAASNGLFWFGVAASGNRTSGYPNAGMVTSEPNAHISALWMDLDPSAAGTVYWDANPNQAMMTWVNVPYWNQPGSSNTLQIRLLPNGDFHLAFGACVNNGGAVTGISEAQNAGNPGSRDWSATTLPFNIGAPFATPLALGNLSSPSINTNFQMQLSNIPANSVVGAYLLSFTRMSSPVAILPGCTQYVGLDATNILVFNGQPTFAFGFFIPNNTGLLGLDVYTQGAAFSPGANAVGVLLSNGGHLRVGL